MQRYKNGEIALKLKRSYTYASKCALILQLFEDEFGVRYFIGPLKVCFEPHMS